MKQWFIQIEDKEKTMKFTVYENGLVYGINRGQKICVLTDSAMSKLKNIIEPNLYLFKTFEYYKENNNNLILKVNDDSRKHRNIKIVGWKDMPKILNVLTDKANYKKVF